MRIQKTGMALLMWLMLAFSGMARATVLATDGFAYTAAADLNGQVSPAAPTSITWTQQYGNFVVTSGQRVRPSGVVACSYTASITPSSADYAVYADVVELTQTNSGNIGIQARVTTTTTAGDTYYEAIFSNGTSGIDLYEVKPGSGGGAGFVHIGSTFTTTYSSGTTHRLGIMCSGTTILVRWDGTTVITGTDTNITGVGKAGVIGNGSGSPAYSDTVGAHLDNFEIDDFAGVTIAPNNAAWVVSPYNWLRTSSTDTTNCVGAYRRILYANSAAVTLLFSSANSNAQVGVRFDGGVGGNTWTAYTVSGTSLSITTPASRTQWRLIEIVYLRCTYNVDAWTSNPPTNAIAFQGLSLDSTATVLKPLVRPKNIIVYADSIGIGANVIQVTGGNFAQDDVTVSVAWNLQYALNAEMCLHSASGAAVNNTTNTASTNHWPALVNSYNLLWNGQSMDLVTTRPDACIVMLGQNDPAGEAGFQTALQTAVSGVNAIKSFLVGDLKNNHQSDISVAANAIGGTYIAPPAFDTTLDTLDTIHPLAEFDTHKYAPTVATGILPVLYGSTTTTLALTIAVSGSNRILTWVADPLAINGYKVERSTDGVNYTVIATVAGGTLTYTDTTRPATGNVYYAVIGKH